MSQIDFAPLGALSSSSLRSLIESDQPLIRDYRNLEAQLQPNGFDLTLESVSLHHGAGVVGQSNEDRVLPDLEPLGIQRAAG